MKAHELTRKNFTSLSKEALMLTWEVEMSSATDVFKNAIVCLDNKLKSKEISEAWIQCGIADIKRFGGSYTFAICLLKEMLVVTYENPRISFEMLRAALMVQYAKDNDLKMLERGVFLTKIDEDAWYCANELKQYVEKYYIGTEQDAINVVERDYSKDALNALALEKYVHYADEIDNDTDEQLLFLECRKEAAVEYLCNWVNDGICKEYNGFLFENTSRMY